MLSLAELCGITFPMLKVHTLILETMVVRFAIPGITRLLQNSPLLKKLIAQAACSSNINVFYQKPLFIFLYLNKDHAKLRLTEQDHFKNHIPLNIFFCCANLYRTDIYFVGPKKKEICGNTFLCSLQDHYLDYYLRSVRGLNPDQCWKSEYIHNFPTSEGIFPMVRCENAASKLFASFMELVLRNSKTLETMVVQFRSTYHPLALECFEQLLQMPPTLPHNNNVSIVLNPSNYSLVASVSLI